MKLYMLVTADKYELPLAVRDSVGEIADLIGRLKYDVHASISKKLPPHRIVVIANLSMRLYFFAP